MLSHEQKEIINSNRQPIVVINRDEFDVQKNKFLGHKQKGTKPVKNARTAKKISLYRDLVLPLNETNPPVQGSVADRLTVDRRQTYKKKYLENRIIKKAKKSYNPKPTGYRYVSQKTTNFRDFVEFTLERLQREQNIFQAKKLRRIKFAAFR